MELEEEEKYCKLKKCSKTGVGQVLIQILKKYS